MLSQPAVVDVCAPAKIFGDIHGSGEMTLGFPQGQKRCRLCHGYICDIEHGIPLMRRALFWQKTFLVASQTKCHGIVRS